PFALAPTLALSFWKRAAGEGGHRGIEASGAQSSWGFFVWSERGVSARDQGRSSGDPRTDRDGNRRGRGADRPRRGDRDRGGRARPPARHHARVPRPRLRVALPAEGAADLR